jgi:hypothetical protein
VADIDKMRRRLPQGGALDTLVERVLSTDWHRNDEKEPEYRRALDLTAGLEGLKLKEGESIFLAFQDGKQRCVFCSRPSMKPHRLARHIRSHFGLRPYECQLPGCTLCKDV